MTVGPKRLGCCLGCGTECYEIVAVHETGPLAGHPRRLGAMRPGGTQVEFLMSDGTEADVTFCVSCAVALQPEEYQRVWEACLDRHDLSIHLAGLTPQERRRRLLPAMRIWPLAILRRRREVPELSALTIDRRRDA